MSQTFPQVKGKICRKKLQKKGAKNFLTKKKKMFFFKYQFL